MSSGAIWTDDTRSRYAEPGRDTMPNGHFWVAGNDTSGRLGAQSPLPEVEGSGTDTFAPAERLNGRRVLLEALQPCGPFLTFALGHGVPSKGSGDPSKLHRLSIMAFAGYVRFCVALASSNVYAGVKGALRNAHGVAFAEGVSDYHLTLGVSSVCRGLASAVPAETWSEIGGWSVEQMSPWLLSLAERTKLSRYPKTKRGPKKPRTPEPDSRTRHIATSRLLNDEQT